MKAIWNGHVVAESDHTIIIEGNHYFPPSDVNRAYLQPSDLHTVCPWKGEASYYSLKDDDKLAQDVAWTYKQPKEMAKQIADYIAFYKDKVAIEA